MICQHLDDICGAAPADSTALHRLDNTFIEVAADLGIRLAPRSDPEKSFAPCKQGIVFGIHYDTQNWTWSIPQDKLVRIIDLIQTALAATSFKAKDVKSLVGKLIHIKALIPAARFNADHIMKWLADSNNMDPVPLNHNCKRQLDYWLLLIRTCNGLLSIPDTRQELPAWALDVYCDAAGGSRDCPGRGSGGVCGPLWYYHQWHPSINGGVKRWDGKKVSRKLTALELMGPLIFLAAAPDAFRRQSARFWIDNAGSVAVWKKGYSSHCSLSSTIIKATAAVAAAVGCNLTIKKITRCSSTGAKLADALSKANFRDFFSTADLAKWQVCQEPLTLPGPLVAWLANPSPDDDLGLKIISHLASKTQILGLSAS